MGSFLADPSAGAHAQEDEGLENVSPPKIEENIGAVPSGSTTDAEVVQRLMFLLKLLWEFCGNN
jgi:hypothetical protein